MLTFETVSYIEIADRPTIDCGEQYIYPLNIPLAALDIVVCSTAHHIYYASGYVPTISRRPAPCHLAVMLTAVVQHAGPLGDDGRLHAALDRELRQD